MVLLNRLNCSAKIPRNLGRSKSWGRVPEDTVIVPATTATEYMQGSLHSPCITKISLRTKGTRGWEQGMRFMRNEGSPGLGTRDAIYADKESKPCTTCAESFERKKGARGKKRRKDTTHGATSPQSQCWHQPNTPAKQQSLWRT